MIIVQIGWIRRAADVPILWGTVEERVEHPQDLASIAVILQRLETEVEARGADVSWWYAGVNRPEVEFSCCTQRERRDLEESDRKWAEERATRATG